MNDYELPPRKFWIEARFFVGAVAESCLCAVVLGGDAAYRWLRRRWHRRRIF